MITIYGSNGTAKTQVPCDDNSTQAKELQGDNVLTLSFTLYEHVALEVNDYTEFLGERYWIMERYKPEQVSTMEWKYDVKLYGIESLVNRFLVLNDTDGADEPVFTLTAPPREHVALIVRSINNGMGTTDWKTGEVTGTDNIVIDYEGKYCGDALKEVTEKVGGKAEWWMDGMTVNVCRCERGEEITLGYGKGLTSLSQDMADNVDFYTRLYPVGSSRNIDPEKYGHTRLQLPGGLKHVDVNVDKYGVWHRYEEAAFSDIYPKYIGTVGSVRSEEATGEDGEPFTIWYFKDDSLPFDPNDYEIGSKVKRVSFQEGSSLAGLGTEEEGTYYFEADFNSDTREWEIITIWPYGDDTQLPNGTLCPKPGDKYIPWNIRMPDEYYTLAEQEYLEAVNAYNEENALDAARYKAPTDHVYIEENSIDLYLGRKVKLESDKYFPETGFRSSRITKITRKVNLPSQMELEISDAVSVGARESINDSIEGVKNYIQESSSNFPDVVRSWENTPLSDYNVLSALNSLMKFLRKDRPDSTNFLLGLKGGAEFGEYMSKKTGGKIDADGAAELLSLILREGIESADFTTGALGAGFCIKKDENGNYYLEVDNMLVRKSATFIELLIQSLRHVGGQIILTPASMSCTKVEEYDTFYRCYFNTTDGEKTIFNEFAEGDQARCQTFNVKEGVNENVSNQYYWRLITGVGDNYIDLSKTDCDSGSTVPQAVDDIVQLGNRTDPARQAAIILSSYGNDAPYFKLYRGIDSYSLSGKEFVSFSRTDIMIIADSIRFSSGESLKDYIDNAVSSVNNDLQLYKQTVFSLFEQTNMSISLAVQSSKEYTDGKIQEAIGNADWVSDDDFLTYKQEVESKFTVMDEGIQSKVDSTTYEAKINEIDGTIESVQTTLTEVKQELTPEGIFMKVSEQVKLGGRNIIKHSRGIDVYRTKYDEFERSVTDAPTTGTGKKISFEVTKTDTSTDEKGSIHIPTWITPSNPTSQGALILRFSASCNRTMTVTVGITEKFSKDVTLHPYEEWIEVVADQKKNDTVLNATEAEVSFSANWREGDIITLHSLKLENGNIPTDWSPAPEDEGENENHALSTTQDTLVTEFENDTSQYVELPYKVQGLKDGDVVTVSFDYNASGLKFTNQALSKIRVEFEDVYGGNVIGELFDDAEYDEEEGTALVSGSGRFISDPVTIGGGATVSDISIIYIRLDYVDHAAYLSGIGGIGKLEISHLKMEKGEYATPWTVAPSDYATVDELVSGITIEPNKINIFSKEISLTGMVTFESLSGDLIEGEYIKSSLIDVEKLAIKSVSDTDSLGITTTLDKNGLEMVYQEVKLLDISQKDITTPGNTTYDLNLKVHSRRNIDGELYELDTIVNGGFAYLKSDKAKTYAMLSYAGIALRRNDNDSFVLRPRSAWVGLIGSTGSVTRQYGTVMDVDMNFVTGISARRTGTGRYRVTHNLGTTSYFVNLTPFTANAVMTACIETISTDYFEFSTFNVESQAVNAQCFVEIICNNGYMYDA